VGKSISGSREVLKRDSGAGRDCVVAEKSQYIVCNFRAQNRIKTIDRREALLLRLFLSIFTSGRMRGSLLRIGRDKACQNAHHLGTEA
jgi:hypothetical protein